MLHTVLVIFHLFLSIALIGLILIQHGKGADAGAAFGSGASGTVFGARGAANFLSRTTAVLATLFFITSLALAWSAMKMARESGIMASAPEAEAIPAPVQKKPVSDLPPVNEAQAPASDLPAVPAAGTQAGGAPSKEAKEGESPAQE